MNKKIVEKLKENIELKIIAVISAVIIWLYLRIG